MAAPLTARLGGAGEPRERIASGRSTRSDSREHLVVVGAGAFGGWTALALVRAGMRVTLVDAWGAGHSRASSGGETRVIRAAYGGVPVYSEMAARALALWREAEQKWGRQVLFRTGALWMFATDDDYVRRSIDPMKAVGLSMEELSPDDAARRYPQMGFRDVRTVFLEPEAGYIAARSACELVRETFVHEGGTYRQGWARPGATAGERLSSVTLSDGVTIDADGFVFACGPWMPQVFPDVIGRRIVATRQEVFFFGTPAGDTRYEPGALPVWVHIGERFVYGTPGHERRGLKVADDTAGEEVDPTTMDRAPSAAGLAGARAILAERFPALADAPLVEARVCQYEASSDGHFLVDRHPRLQNVWLVGGGSGHGFKMGPALGRDVAQMMQGRMTVHPLFAYGRLHPRPPRASTGSSGRSS
ncbi:MAG TPA: FAD-dependent oxidoreductase [Gemmatimonadaceae bacterium]|nr:FAD-dependent oxidoreductase [Gemmatimonadaceae bacterium]